MAIVGGTDRDYSAGAIVELTPLARQWKDLYDWGIAEHNQDGTHSDITANSLSVAENIDVADTKAIRDGNNNELLKFAQTASAVNELTLGNAAASGHPYLQASGGDTNINTNLIPKGTGKVTKSGNPIDWWEEIGRTTLGSAGDTISVTSLPVRKYLRIIVKTITSGTINNVLRFNNDSGNNYAYRRSESFAAGGSTTSAAQIDIGGTASAANRFSVTDVINIAAHTKTAIGNVVETNGAASAAPITGQHFAKWVNTADSITRVDVLNTQAGDFAIGSEVVILGHD